MAENWHFAPLFSGIHRGSTKYWPTPSISFGAAQQGWLAFALRRRRPHVRIVSGAPLRTKPRTFSFAVRNDSLKDVLAADDPDRVVVYFDRTDDGADSRYDRQVADLPCSGKQIRLWVITRRFVCEVPHCRRQISLNDSEMMFCRPVCAGRHGWNASSTISGWHLAADQQQVSSGG